MAILNSFVNDIFERIATEASSASTHPFASSLPYPSSELAQYSKKSTISSREIQTSVRLILPGELAKHAISEGVRVPSCYFPLPLLIRRADEVRDQVLVRNDNKMNKPCSFPLCRCTWSCPPRVFIAFTFPAIHNCSSTQYISSASHCHVRFARLSRFGLRPFGSFDKPTSPCQSSRSTQDRSSFCALCSIVVFCS